MELRYFIELRGSNEVVVDGAPLVRFFINHLLGVLVLDNMEVPPPRPDITRLALDGAFILGLVKFKSSRLKVLGDAHFVRVLS
mmetsp:Transcript_29185/g.43998  ORF Transcript_29185/g.43998 Transcript_29185/m.43998 type:complete len:83 (+) Transcript_29185:1580-1828(+)